MKAQWWFVVSAVAVIAAFVARYVVSPTIGLSFRSGGGIRGIPLNVIAFWVILAFAVLVLVAHMVTLARR